MAGVFERSLEIGGQEIDRNGDREVSVRIEDRGEAGAEGIGDGIAGSYSVLEEGTEPVGILVGVGITGEGDGVRGIRISAGGSAVAPVEGVIGVESEAWCPQDEAAPVAIGFEGPLGPILVGEIQNLRSKGVVQDELLAMNVQNTIGLTDESIACLQVAGIV